jgi:type IV secretion system protein VirD4
MGMSLNIIIQNLAQLKARYEKTWEVITGNCDTILFLGGQEESTLKYISESLGKETIDVRGQNKTLGKQKSTSENNSILGRELMQPNEILTMPITDCIVMVRSHNPFYCTKYPIEHHPNFKFLEDYDKNNAFDVHKIKAVSVAEFESANKSEKEKVDTYINSADSDAEKEQNDKIDTIFKREEIDYTVTSETLEFDSYEEAELYATLQYGETVSEEYADDSPKYGSVSELSTFDLGEPDETRREVLENDDEDAADGNSVITSVMDDEGADAIHYDEVDEDAEPLDNIDDVFAEADTLTTEVFGDSFIDFPDEDDYGFIDM